MPDFEDDATHALDAKPATSPLDEAILAELQSSKPEPARPIPNLPELIEKFRRLSKASSVALERVRYFGDYLLIAEIGRGGMGIVYRARQVSLNRDVALKMLMANQFTAKELLVRFRLEAEAAATLDHPHIVPVYEVGEVEKQPYYCMKFIEGTNLAESKQQWVVNEAQLTRSAQKERSQRVAGLVEKLARAMHYAHQRGILHRDLKPSNILLDVAGQPHITDFGLAKLLDAPTEMTITGAVLGTPSYMAPEQAAGSKVITTAVDVYGLGAILYELLTGRPPFKGESSAQTLRLVLETEPKRPCTIVPHLDRDLESICLKCIAREKNDRYASADALANDLRRYLRSETTHARPSTLRERAWKWCRRNPAVAALIASALLTVLVFVIGLTTSNIIITRAQAATERSLEHQQQANYIKTVSLAHRDLQEGDPTRTLDMLANCDPKRRDWEWNYLKRAAEANYRKFEYPSDVCMDIAFSTNGKCLAALVSKGTGPAKPIFANVSVAILDPTSGKLQRMLAAPGLALDRPMEWWRPGLKFSRGGHFIGIYGTFAEGDKLHGAVRCFDGTKDWQPKKLKMDLFRDQIVMGIFFDNKNRLYALTHPQIDVNDRDEVVDFQVIDVESGTTKLTFKASGRQSSPQLNRDCSVLLIGGRGLDAIDFKTGEFLPPGDLGQLLRFTSNLAISADDKYIACVENYGRLLIFDYTTRKKLREIEAHRDGAYDLAFSGLNKEIVTVGWDGALKRWRINDGELLGRLHIGEPLTDVAVNPQTGEVVAPDNIGTLAAWNSFESNALQVRNPREGAYFTQLLDFCPDGSRVFALESGMHLTVWDALTKERIQAIEFHKWGDATLPDAMWVAPTHNGKLAAIRRGSYDNPKRLAPIEIWDIDAGELVADMPLTTSPAEKIVWNNEETIIAANLKDNRIVGFDTALRQQIWETLVGFECWIGRHPKSGKMYVVEKGSTTSQSRVVVLDMRTGKELRRLAINKSALRVRRFSFDGKLLLASIDGTNESRFLAETALIDSETGMVQENHFLGSRPEIVMDLFLTKDGKRLFVQSGKGEFRIWDRHARELILSLRDSHTSFDWMTLAPDGLAVVGTSTGRGFYLWDGRAFADESEVSSNSLKSN